MNNYQSQEEFEHYECGEETSNAENPKQMNNKDILKEFDKKFPCAGWDGNQTDEIKNFIQEKLEQKDEEIKEIKEFKEYSKQIEADNLNIQYERGKKERDQHWKNKIEEAMPEKIILKVDEEKFDKISVDQIMHISAGGYNQAIEDIKNKLNKC